jgi:multiple sugar transport system substrate-binding protein
MVNHRNRVTMLLAVIFILLLSACTMPAVPPADGGAAPAAPAAEGVTTITWAMWGDPAEIETHQRVADAFMAEHPEIRVEIASEPWSDYFTKITTLWASGDSSVIPDVLFMSPVINRAADGVLENLDPYIEAAGYDLDDYWPALLEWSTYNGSVYGFPRDMSSEVLYYNQEIFDEAGLAYPDESWTWDDLLAAAEQLTIVEPNGRVARYALAMEGGKYSQWVAQNNGQILDDMRNPSECLLDEPAAVEAVQFFAEMMDNNYAMRPANLNQAGGDSAVFQSGQVAMIIQNASRISAFNAAEMPYDVAVLPIPEGGKRTNSAAGAAWVMSANADNKEAGWVFLQWLQSTDGGQRIYTESGEILPALQSTARGDAFLGLNQPPANRQAFLIEGESAEVGRLGYFAHWNELAGTIISPNLERIWAGEAPVEATLTDICQQVDAYLAEHGYPQQ